MIVMKFGGTSVGNPQAIERVANIVKSRVQRCPLIVVSAVSGITNKLVKLSLVAVVKNRDSAIEIIAQIRGIHDNLISNLGLAHVSQLQELLTHVIEQLEKLTEKISQSGDLTKHLTDQVLNFGELLSANMVTHYLRARGVDCAMVDARDYIVTDSQFGKALPLIPESTTKIQHQLLPLVESKAIVTQGFVGRDTFGRVTTLGRGGSDYSATLFGAMLGVEEVEIWTDVDGIMTADPTIVLDARRIRQMSFQEAAELAYFGAKVLHPATLLPAIEKGIPVRVLNSMRQGDLGTTISKNPFENGSTECVVKSIAYKEKLTVITVISTRMLMAFGFMSSIFDIFARYNTSVDLVSTSEVSVSITIDNTDRLEEIRNELSRFAQVHVEGGKAIVSLVGDHLKRTPGMPGRIFSLIQDTRIYLISQGASEKNISFVIDESEIEKVVRRLHEHFFRGPLNPVIFAV